jgi:two-component system response regulator RegA
MSAASAFPRLLIADDDDTFREVLGRALARRGFEVVLAPNATTAMELVRAQVPAYAVVDLRMPGASGLSLVESLRQASDRMRIVVLTGYASITTAVEAIKLGATHYLAKPADADQIVAAFGDTTPVREVQTDPRPLSVDRLEWEHIQRVLAEHEGNVSATARALGMHRRTLQRKLSKHPPRE